MNHTVVAIRTDGSGYSNVTAALGDQRSRAIQQANDLNMGSLYVMQANRPGAERAIPDVIYSAGYGPEVLSEDGEMIPPYNGELSATTSMIATMVEERIEKYGEKGVVRFDAYSATQRISPDASPDEKRSALSGIFDDVRRGAEMATKKPAPAAKLQTATPQHG